MDSDKLIRLSSSTLNDLTKCGKMFNIKHEKGIREQFNSLTFEFGFLTEYVVQEVLLHPKKSIYENVIDALDKRYSEGRTAVSTDFLMTLCDYVHAWFSDKNHLVSKEVCIALNEAGHECFLGWKGYAPPKNYTGYGANGKAMVGDNVLSNTINNLLEGWCSMDEDRAFKDMVCSFTKVESQVRLQMNIAVEGTVLELTGTPDFLCFIESDRDKRLILLDSKQSKHNYAAYNKEADTQLLQYALMMKKIYGKEYTLDVGFVTPNNRGEGCVHWVDTEKLLSKQNISRLKDMLKLYVSGIRLPVCGCGAYQSNNMLCDYKKHCEFSSYSKKDEVSGAQTP